MRGGTGGAAGGWGRPPPGAPPGPAAPADRQPPVAGGRAAAPATAPAGRDRGAATPRGPTGPDRPPGPGDAAGRGQRRTGTYPDDGGTPAGAGGPATGLGRVRGLTRRYGRATGPAGVDRRRLPARGGRPDRDGTHLCFAPDHGGGRGGRVAPRFVGRGGPCPRGRHRGHRFRLSPAWRRARPRCRARRATHETPRPTVQVHTTTAAARTRSPGAVLSHVPSRHSAGSDR